MLDQVEKEQLLEFLLRNDADPMFCKNDRLQYTMVNPAMEKLFNLPSDKILGKKAAAHSSGNGRTGAAGADDSGNENYQA